VLGATPPETNARSLNARSDREVSASRTNELNRYHKPVRAFRVLLYGEPSRASPPSFDGGGCFFLDRLYVVIHWDTLPRYSLQRSDSLLLEIISSGRQCLLVTFCPLSLIQILALLFDLFLGRQGSTFQDRCCGQLPRNVDMRHNRCYCVDMKQEVGNGYCNRDRQSFGRSASED